MQQEHVAQLMAEAFNLDPEHNHILQKDPKRYGYKCEVEGCTYFLGYEVMESRLDDPRVS